jgi:voltage-dependent potassium channel beta subunit
MNYRRVGNSGLKVSAVSLGAWTTYGHTVQDQQRVREIVARAVEAGINFFDNADAYARGEAERVMARVYDDLDIPRHHLVLSTKVYWPMSDAVTDSGLSRKHVHESIDRSLERMETDYVDLYFAHRYDTETPLEEIVEGFSDVVRSGSALYWGTSMWPNHRIAEAVAFARANGLVAPIVEQPQYSMLARQRVEDEILPVTVEKGMGLVVFSPLAQGMLTGKYDDGVPEGSRFDNFKQTGDRLLTDENAAKVRALKVVADDLGVTRAQLALAWVLRQPSVSSVITGATRVEQLEDNLQAAALELSDADIAQIDDALGD